MSVSSQTCPYQRCFHANIFTLPKTSSPRIISSAVATGAEFNPKNRASWELVAKEDMDVQRALQNASCCYLKGQSATGGPQVCHLADSEQHSVRLPPACQHQGSFNASECVCSVIGARQLYCGTDVVVGEVKDDCDKILRVGETIECRKNQIVVGRTNTIEAKIPVGCRFSDKGETGS